MTGPMNLALRSLQRARVEDPGTDDGIMAGVGSYYDSEIAVAYVHWRTARALARSGLVQVGEWYGPEEGTPLTLTAKGLAA